MTDLNRLGERLKLARLLAGYQHAKDAALAVKVPVATYYQHEADGDRLAIPKVRYYAESFGVSAAWLAFGEYDAEGRCAVPIGRAALFAGAVVYADG